MRLEASLLCMAHSWNHDIINRPETPPDRIAVDPATRWPARPGWIETRNLAIANRSRVSCAHNTPRASIVTLRPWNLVKGSLKVIGNGAIRLTEFLLAFHSNYGAILYRLRDSNLLVESRQIFYTPTVFRAPAGGDAVGISFKMLILINLEWLGYRVVIHFHRIPERDGQTGRQTERTNSYINIASQCTDAR